MMRLYRYIKFLPFLVIIIFGLFFTLPVQQTRAQFEGSLSCQCSDPTKSCTGCTSIAPSLPYCIQGSCEASPGGDPSPLEGSISCGCTDSTKECTQCTSVAGPGLKYCVQGVCESRPTGLPTSSDAPVPAPAPAPAGPGDACAKCITDCNRAVDIDTCLAGCFQKPECKASTGGGNQSDPKDKNGSGFGNPDNKKFSEVAYSYKDLLNIFFKVVCDITRVAMAVVVIFLVYSGFLFMTAQGDPTKRTKAIENLKSVIIGVVVIMGIGVILSTVAFAVGVDIPILSIKC